VHEAEKRYRELGPESLKQTDDLVAVIRGHLWIEFLLNTALEDAMSQPSEMSLDRMSFPTRVDLAVALGILSRSEGNAYVQANWLRNRFAHDPDFLLDEQSVERVWNSIPVELRIPEAHPFALKGGTPKETFIHAFGILMVRMDTAVTRLRDQKIEQQAFLEAICGCGGSFPSSRAVVEQVRGGKGPEGSRGAPE
jgi:hypothetical protein